MIKLFIRFVKLLGLKTKTYEKDIRNIDFINFFDFK